MQPLQPAWVLHTRPFRDSSVLVDVLTESHGRFTGLLKGARSMRSKKRTLSQPFTPLLIGWSGRSSLVTFSHMHLAGQPYDFMGSVLISALYLNELLVKLLHQGDPHPAIYGAYTQTLKALNQGLDMEPVLRLFEYACLSALGYGFEINKDYQTGTWVEQERYYHFVPWKGLTRCGAVPDGPVFLGGDLQAFVDHDFSKQSARVAAKHLMRLMIQTLLGHKKIQTRLLFQSMP